MRGICRPGIFKPQAGQGTVEYSLILAFVAVVAVVLLAQGPTIRAAIADIMARLTAVF